MIRRYRVTFTDGRRPQTLAALSLSDAWRRAEALWPRIDAVRPTDRR